MESICDGTENAGLTLKKDMRDVAFEQFDLELPLRSSPLANVEGRVDATVSLLKRNGHTRAAVSTAFKFSHNGDAEEFNLAKEEGRGISADEAAVAEQQTGS